MNYIQAVKLKKNYQTATAEIPALIDLSFSLDKGDFTVILGPSGSGKTTLLKQIFKNNNDAIKIDENIKLAYLSQMQREVVNESNTILK